MTKTKKALMGLTALLMAFSMTAFTACSNSNNNNNNNNNNENNNNNNNENNNDNPGTVTLTDAEKIMAAAAKQSVAGVSVNYSLISDVTTNMYESDEDGVKKPDGQEMTMYSKGTSGAKATVDLTSFNVDSSNYSVNKEVDKDGKEVADSESNYSEYSYDYVRDGKSFWYNSNAEVTDITKVALQYDGESEDGEDVSFDTVTTIDGVMGVPFNTIINLSKVYESNTYSNGKLTINLNKVAHKLYNEVLAVLDGLKETSTVGEVIESKPVKNLMDSLTYGYTAKGIYDEVKTALGGDQMDAQTKAIFDLVPVPAEGASVHTYLVSVLKDKEFAGKIMAMINPNAPSSAVAPLYDFTVLDVVKIVMSMMQNGGNEKPNQGNTEQGGVATLAEESEGENTEASQEITVEALKAMAKQYLNEMVSITEDKVTISTEYATVEVSALTAEISVNDKYEITSVKASGDVKAVSVMAHHVGDDAYMGIETDTTAKFEATVNISATAPALTDISNNDVISDVANPEVNGAYYYVASFGHGEYQRDLVLRVTLGEKNGDSYAVTKIEALKSIGGEVIGTATPDKQTIVLAGLIVNEWELEYMPGFSYRVECTIVDGELGDVGTYGSYESLKEVNKVSAILAK